MDILREYGLIGIFHDGTFIMMSLQRTDDLEQLVNLCVHNSQIADNPGFFDSEPAVFNILLNLWLIPAYSWRGAAWSSLASDGMLALSLWVTVLWLGRQEGARQLAASENLA